MSSRNIGKIISIGIKGIIAEVYDNMGNYINTLDGVRFVGEVGSYVSIYDIGRTIIAEVTGVDEKTSVANQALVKPNSSRQIYLSLLGEIINGIFYFGVSKMPLIFSEIHIISEKDLKTMLEVGNEEEDIPEMEGKTRALLLPIGESVIFPDYAVRINIDKFFGFHFAVFGNTGAGKSNTIAKILQIIFEKKDFSAKGAKFVIIDSNGEYCKAFSELSNQNDKISVKSFLCDCEKECNMLQIPVWALSADDWAVLLHASERTQIPILKRAIDIAKIFYGSEEGNTSVKNHILASTVLGIVNSSDSSPSKADKLTAIITTFKTTEINLDVQVSTLSGSTLKLRELIKVDFGKMKDQESLIKYLEKFIDSDLVNSLSTSRVVPYDMKQFVDAVEFATLYEGSVSSQRIQEYTATLLTRLQSVQDGIQGSILTKTQFTTIDEYINNILGENQIVDIDISCLDDASAEVVTKVLAKLLLDYLKKREPKADMPINFIIEEAHRFVRNESSYGAVGYNIFERIAKEGRKFGLLLGISSQRPSELSKTVVSQSSNFIIHRVQNPDDLQYISRMVPYVNQGIIERLTYLQTGNALVFGSAINLPTLTRFEEANPATDSQNAKISEKWYIE
ncbi:MAG: ATP-binding protein [Candidatus Galacturonibacter soehngenii]|nr:ATP-binding protein [Candidatus Galacturonibacter soehngenii]